VCHPLPRASSIIIIIIITPTYGELGSEQDQVVVFFGMDSCAALGCPLPATEIHTDLSALRRGQSCSLLVYQSVSRSRDQPRHRFPFQPLPFPSCWHPLPSMIHITFSQTQALERWNEHKKQSLPPGQGGCSAGTECVIYKQGNVNPGTLPS
jgi:hypothetical protein